MGYLSFKKQDVYCAKNKGLAFTENIGINHTVYFIRINALLALLVFLSINLSAQSFAPVNKNATPEAKNLLKYLYSISGKSILSGEHGGGNRFLDSTKSISGKYPAVWGSDFIWSGADGGGQKVVNEAIANYKCITREGQWITHHMVLKKVCRQK